MEIKPLIWTDEQPSNRVIHYSHITASTPFGRFLITWKAWKEHDCPTIDETPWGGFGGVGNDVNEAKEIAEIEYSKRVKECLSL